MKEIKFTGINNVNPLLNKNVDKIENPVPNSILKFDSVNNEDFSDVVGYSSPFSFLTTALMLKYIPHRTKMLNVAQSLLGLQEVTAEEYALLSPDEQKKTQMRVIGRYGNVNDQWCAHTVSYICEQSGININGHKSAVRQFVEWGTKNDRYNPITVININSNNYVRERQNRKRQIADQLKNMHEGDLIIWKTDYVVKFDDGKVEKQKSSHIGVIESVDIQNGIVTVIEGNANEPLTGRDFERVKVKTPLEGINGNQKVGEVKEINRRDGLIRKQYKIEDLANFGYSGYINMQGLIK